jgi:hypothetical protein
MTDMAPQNNVKTLKFRIINLANVIVTTNRSKHISHTTHTPCFAPVDISVRYTRTMIYIASYAPFDISVRYTRTMIYIASSAPFDISVRYTRTMIYIASYARYQMEHVKLYISLSWCT